MPEPIPAARTRGGFFLSFEGMDGAGKGTQIALLADALRARGIEPVIHREPGGTLIGQQIRAILLDAANTHLLPTAELLLYFASRAQAVDEVILPALAQGKLVIADRFTDSTLVYQGVARGLGADVVRQLDAIACRGLSPDLTILLDIDPATSLERALARNQAEASNETRLDDESREFHTRVREGYLALAREFPDRIAVLEASGRREHIARGVLDVLLPRMAGHVRASEPVV